jgi:molybdopterin synthase sulfur carrier subunit
VALVWIPALLRDLTGGAEAVSVPGESLRQVILALDERYPGLAARLCEGEAIRPNLSVVVDGEVSRRRLRQPLQPDSEVHFVPVISGG